MKPALSLEQITKEKQYIITISATIINIVFLIIYWMYNLNIFDKLLMFFMFTF